MSKFRDLGFNHLLAKLCAIKEVLIQASEMGIQSVAVYSDCKEAIRLLSIEEEYRCEISTWLGEISNLRKNFVRARFVHTKRSGNEDG